MTTELEAELLPEVLELVKEFGTTATFTLYPSATSDTDASTVTLGAATVYTPKVTPPEDLDEEYAPDGSVTKNKGVKFYVPSGALTAEPLGFVPAVGQRVNIRSVDWRVDRVEVVSTGDEVWLYLVEARA